MRRLAIVCWGWLIFSLGVGNTQVLIDGVVRDVDHRADASTFRRPSASGVVWASRPIYHTGAEFLRLHFTDVRDDRATDYTVCILTGDDALRRPFRGRSEADPCQTPLSWAPEDIGRSSDFWTPRINADRVQVIVTAEKKPTGLSFRVSELAYSRVEFELLGTFVTKPNYSHLHEHAGNHPLMEAARAVARLDFIADGQSKACTGFLISNNRVLTNDHCISSQEVCESAWVVFDHTLAPDGSEAKGLPFRCRQLVSDPGGALAGLDGAVVEVYGDPGADGRMPLRFAARPADRNHSLVMLHHPGAEPMRVSTKRCRVRTEQAPGAGGRLVDFGHRCDSNPGSSGAPILNLETLEIVGLHHWGFEKFGPFMRENRAVRAEHFRPLMP